jgi:hypothetical protein
MYCRKRNARVVDTQIAGTTRKLLPTKKPISTNAHPVAPKALFA